MENNGGRLKKDMEKKQTGRRYMCREKRAMKRRSWDGGRDKDEEKDMSGISRIETC